MELTRIVVGPFEVNCYLIDPGEPGDWAVVDPGFPQAELVDALKERTGRAGHILLTHGHFDHIGGIPAVLEACESPCSLAVHPTEREMICAEANSWLPYYPQLDPDLLSKVPVVDLPNSGEVELGTLRFNVLAAPGHTPGGTMLWFKKEGWAFTGDTLFRGSVGRTDLPGGSPAELLKSLRDRLGELPDETQIYPGHGPPTDLATERASNPFLIRPGELLGEGAP